MLVDGTSIGTFEGIPMSRPATSLVALACCCAGSPAGPATEVVAEATLAWSGAGRAGTLPPALAAWQVAAPAFADTGGVAGWPTSVVAEQFHPAAEEGAGTTTTPAMVRAMRGSVQSGRTSMSLGSDRPSEDGA